MAWNKPSGAPKPVQKKPSAMRGVVAGAVVVVAAVLFFVVFMGKGEKRVENVEKERGRIKEATPAKPGKVKSLTREVSSNRKTADDIIAKMEESPKPKIKMRELTPEEWLSVTNRAFSTTMEQVMSWVFTVEPGDPPPPIMPIGIEARKNLAAILISKNEIKDSDSDRVAFSKEQVDRAKKEMAKYIGDGGDPDEFLQYYREELKLAFNKRRDAMEQIEEVAEEDPELAKDLRKKVNEYLESQGIKKIPEPVEPEKEEQ